MHDLAGIIVDERYSLDEILGTGAYGVVYLATDTAPGANEAQYAIKVVQKIGRSPTAVEKIHREAEIQSTVCAHRNIVTIHDAFEDADHIFFVLDRCTGGDLRRHVSGEGTYLKDEGKLRRVLVSLIDAVEACHDKHVFHRDLKPENIFTNEDGSEAYLGDFGLATYLSSTSELGHGTMPYMSPGEPTRAIG